MIQNTKGAQLIRRVLWQCMISARALKVTKSAVVWILRNHPQALGRWPERYAAYRSIREELAEAPNVGASVNNAFFRENYLTLDHLQKRGVDLDVNADRVIGSVDGIRFHFFSKEEFQVVDEVYIFNTYNVISDREKLVVDIGMNTGHASLFFAKQRSVIEVHSYEPFSIPFNRAKSNFIINLPFAEKIHANHYGLGGSDEETTVLSCEENTISTSIRGAHSGTPETISIRSASRELSILVESARARNLDLVVKMDCEGSEFQIMEALERDDLLSKIDVMMIEWHKWWSKEKSSANLIEPLIATGFTIFDRTVRNDPYVGLLYAVRSGGKANARPAMY